MSGAGVVRQGGDCQRVREQNAGSVERQETTEVTCEPANAHEAQHGVGTAVRVHVVVGCNDKATADVFEVGVVVRGDLSPFVGLATADVRAEEAAIRNDVAAGLSDVPISDSLDVRGANVTRGRQVVRPDLVEGVAGSVRLLNRCGHPARCRL